VSIVTPGTEWQVRDLAHAADSADEHYRVNAPGTDRDTERSAAYCRGVADVLRLIVGDLTDDQSRWPAELVRINETYSAGI
jgi:hypothetical protein